MAAKLHRYPWLATVSITCLVCILVLGIRNAGYLELLELEAHDWFIRLQARGGQENPRVVIIGITEDDIRKMGRWPVSDAVLAQALEILAEARPHAIGIDLFRDIPVPPGTDALYNVLSQQEKIIVSFKFGNDGVPPPAIVKQEQRLGFNDIIVDPGGTVRRGILFMDDGQQVFFSFALRLALLYAESSGIVPQPDPINPAFIRLGRTTIKPFESSDGGYNDADARGYQFLLDYKWGRKAFPRYSLTQLLKGQVPPVKINRQVVIVGVVAESVKDLFYTPLSRGHYDHQQTTGVELHGHIVNQLLRFALDGQRSLRVLTNWHETGWIFLWCLLGGALGQRVRSPWRLSLLGGGGVVFMALCGFGAFFYSYWIPVVPAALSWVSAGALVTAYISNIEKKYRASLMNLFSRHVSPEVADAIWQQRDQFLNDGRPRSKKMDVTVLFSDLKGFTTVSEKMEPQTLYDWLNEYMEAMVQLIIKHGGVIDDYAGDGIKANFGVPFPRQTRSEVFQDAENAVNCALDMEQALGELNKNWVKRNLPSAGIRVGIYTGPVVAGALGGTQRLKYTTVGDTVNTAARLESFGREIADETFCRILVGGLAVDHLAHHFDTERVGDLSLKGKDTPITVYRIRRQNSSRAKDLSAGVNI